MTSYLGLSDAGYIRLTDSGYVQLVTADPGQPPPETSPPPPSTVDVRAIAAAHALEGLLASGAYRGRHGEAAADAVLHADALVAKLSEGDTGTPEGDEED